LFFPRSAKPGNIVSRFSRVAFAAGALQDGLAAQNLNKNKIQVSPAELRRLKLGVYQEQKFQGERDRWLRRIESES
jgi:hypothetical protein